MELIVKVKYQELIDTEDSTSYFAHPGEKDLRSCADKGHLFTLVASNKTEHLTS